MGKAARGKGFLLVAVSVFVFGLSGVAKADETKVFEQTKEGLIVSEQTKNIQMQGTGKIKYSAAFDVLDIVNTKRKSAGLKPLVMDESLLQTADIRVKEISKSFSHVRPNGEKCFTAYKRGGYRGENIAYGYTSASAVMKGWMNSQGHKNNILNKEFQSIGIACYYRNGSYYWIQCFSSEKASPVESVEEAKALFKADSSEDIVMKMSGVKIKSASKALVLSWNKIDEIKGYQVQIADSKSFSKAKQSQYSVKASKTSYRIKKLKGKRLKSKKKYYVRIRTYKVDSDGNKIYGKWKMVKAKTK